MSTSQESSSSQDPILPTHTTATSQPPGQPSNPAYTQDDGCVSTSTDVQGTNCDVHPLLDRTNSAEASCLPLPPNTNGNNGDSANYRTRNGRRRQVTILPPITTSALGDLSSTHPSSLPTPGRRRAHTIGVSMKPRTRIPSDFTSPNPTSNKNTIEDERSDRLTPLTSMRRTTNDNNIDLESGLNGNGIQTKRARSSSNASRHSITSAERRSGRSSTPVEFDLVDHNGNHESHQLDDEMIGLLDVIDPQVATVNHLQNMTNSVLVPHLPQLWKRRPEVQLPQTPSDDSLTSLNKPFESTPSTRQRSATTRSRKGSISRFLPGRATTAEPVSTSEPSAVDWGHTQPIPIPEESSPILFESQHRQKEEAGDTDTGSGTRASPRTIQREEMEDDIEDIKEDHELDKHVKHILNSSQREKIKRSLKGLWIFVKTPMGFITAIYGFLVVFWGAAIVIILAGWIPFNTKNTQDIWVEISSQVVNGLFTVTGVGLIPWRAIDTYRMSVIWTLKNRDSRLRKKKGLPAIEDENDLPDPELIKDYVFVLSEKDQKNLRYQQEKFAISQTWYRPHATATHKAFPMKFALWNTILMDGNSAFQCMLCGTMWGLNRHQRPAWTTGCLIPLSFLCGIGAAVLIWQGSARTKKSALVSKKLRDALNVPVAIAVPRSVDGTVMNSTNNTAPATDIPLHKTESPNKPGGGRNTAAGGRRTTITFGHVNNENGDAHQNGDSDEAKKERIGDGAGSGRDRGVTVANPERIGNELDFGLGKVVTDHDHNGIEDGGEKNNHEEIALKEVK